MQKNKYTRDIVSHQKKFHKQLAEVVFDFLVESKQDSSVTDALVEEEEDAINDSTLVASSEEKVAKWEEETTFLDCRRAPTLGSLLGVKEEVAT
jgi:hypothetical protein